MICFKTKKVWQKKTKKKSWFKRQVVKVQILPWYWKMVATVVIFFAGGTLGTQLFTEADDVSMIGGFALLVIVLWFLIQMWLPAPEE